MFAEIGFEGIFEVEFLVDKDDSLYFLEINFRNSTWSYASTAAEMPLPLLWANGMVHPQEPQQAIKNIDVPFTAMVEFDDHRCRVKTHQISNIKWVKDFLNSKCKYYCAANDLSPVISVICSKFRRMRKES